MPWKDEFGREDIFIHPDLIEGDADWRIESAGQRPVDEAEAERLRNRRRAVREAGAAVSGRSVSRQPDS